MQPHIDPQCKTDNALSHSIVQDGSEATTQTPSLYLRALLTCGENQSRSISLTRNIARSVHVQTLYQKNQRACMKSTRNNMQATLLTMVPCCCCLPSKTYGRNGVTPIFRSFHRTASFTTGDGSRWNILMCFYISF